jgi:hypothetical protein
MISDIKTNNMTEDLIVDIWNEPDGSGYWPRPQAQYHQLWARTYNRLRYNLTCGILNSLAIQITVQ